MKHSVILSRSWKIFKEYKALWLFGIFLALTGSNGNSGANGNRMMFRQPMDRQFEFPQGEWFGGDLGGFGRWFGHMFPFNIDQTLIGIVLVLLGALLILSVLFTILRYVSQVALIRMVDGYEATQQKVGIRQGFRLGWSRSAWRLFLINLVVYLPLALVIASLVAAALVPLIVTIARSGNLDPIGLVASTGLFILVALGAIVVGVALSFFMEMISRVCVLEDSGVFASIRQGWRLVTSHFGDVGLLWLIVIGLRIGFGILMIPVYLVVGGVALLFGGGVTAMLYMITSSMRSVTFASWPDMVAGILIALFIIMVPAVIASGLFETYISTSWTIGYRQLTPGEQVAAPPAETGEVAANA